MLGKRFSCEHIGVRHVHHKNTMVLVKRLPREHIGVRRMVWQERPRQRKRDIGKTGRCLMSLRRKILTVGQKEE